MQFRIYGISDLNPHDLFSLQDNMLSHLLLQLQTAYQTETSHFCHNILSVRQNHVVGLWANRRVVNLLLILRFSVCFDTASLDKVLYCLVDSSSCKVS